MKGITSRRRDEQGAVAVLVAVCAVALFVVAAMVVDLGLARDTKRQSQIAADAAALAAANQLYPDSGTCLLLNPWGTNSNPCFADAVKAAKDYSQQNFQVTSSDWSSCPSAARPTDFYSIDTPCISFDTTIAAASKPTKVFVVIPNRPVKTGLGNLAGVSQIDISTQARARVTEGLTSTCGLCFLGPVEAENADFTVEGGSIHVNGPGSDCSVPENTAIDTGPNSNWKAKSITICGAISGKGVFDPPAAVTAHVDDPFASVVLPPNPMPTPLPTNRTDPCATAGHGGGPGYYTQAVDIPKDDCVLQPGLYVISNTWGMKNNTFLKDLGKGVTLYVRSGGYLDFKNGEVSISPMTSGPFAGFTIVYDRANTNMLSLQGNGKTSVQGIVYTPNSLLDFNGNSCFGFSGGPIVALGVEKANGNKSCVTVKDANDVDLPPLPGGISLDQ